MLSEDKGFHVLKGFYTREEAESYRSQCRDFLQAGNVFYTRINTDSMRDYVHPRSHDQQQRTQRIYQYFHNHTDDELARFWGRAVRLRNEIESAWMSDAIYNSEKEKLQDYVIVTAYKENKGMLPMHRDYRGPAKLPLVQFWVLLSEPEVDYQGGNLVLYSQNGHRYRVESDLHARRPGDAVVFNKALYHEVEVTREVPASDLGRWTVLIGASAYRDTRWQAFSKKVRFNPIVYREMKRVKRLLRHYYKPQK